jgi:hypothetical protein
MPARFCLGSNLIEYRLQLFHLGAGELCFQFAAAGGERQLAHTAVVFGGVHRDQFHFDQLAQRGVECLFADIEQAEQFVDRDFRVASDEVEDAVMHAPQAALFQNVVGRVGEGAVAEIELFYCQVQGFFARQGAGFVGIGGWVKHVDMIGWWPLDCLQVKLIDVCGWLVMNPIVFGFKPLPASPYQGRS